MISDIHHIKNELTGLEKIYHQMAFKNKDTLIMLKQMFEKIRDFRLIIISQYPGFSAEPSIDAIIENIQKTIDSEKTTRASLEWTFYHYNDLFVFKVKSLLISMELELK